MYQVLSNFAASISELKKNPSELIEKAHGETIAILNRNTPTAYLVHPKVYEMLLEAIDDIELTQLIKGRIKDLDNAIEVDIDEL